MKKKNIFFTVVLIFLLSVFGVLPVFAEESISYKSLWDEEQQAYIITDVSELRIFRNSLSEHDYSKEKVLLCNDIEINKNDDIGNVVGTAFNGYFNGQGYNITGFNDTTCGLFYTIGADAIVTKINLGVDIKIEQIVSDKTKTEFYAPMVRIQFGKVSYCSVTGKIDISTDVEGGFVISGFAIFLGGDTYDKEYAAGIESGEYPYSDFMIHDCFTELDIHFSKCPGVSQAYGFAYGGYYMDPANLKVRAYNIYVNNKYSYDEEVSEKRTVYTAIGRKEKDFCEKQSIFYTLDEESSSQIKTLKKAAYGIECTTEQLKQKSTYTDAGWDFDKIWDIDINGYYDKIYIQNETPPEDVEIQFDEIGPFYYDSELKYINDGYPYLRADAPEAVYGETQRKGITVSVQYPDIEIGYYAPAVVKPEIQITGIEGVDDSQLQELIDQYEITVSCPEEKIYLISGNTVGSLDDLKTKAKLNYKTNQEYVFDIDFSNSTVIPGTVSALPNSCMASVEEKAAAYLNIGIKDDQASLKKVLDELDSGESSQNVIDRSLCWTVLDLARYDQNQSNQEICDLLDRWFEWEKAAFREMYAENPDMNQVLTTTWQRELIAITAAGFDPADIKAYTKGTHGEDDPGFDLVQSVSNEVGGEGAHMHIPFWLIGLDSGDYPAGSTHEEDVNRRADKVYTLVNMGVFGAGAGISMDYIGMYSQGLAKYINPEEGTIYYEVAQKVNEKLIAEGQETIAQKADKAKVIAEIKKYQCPLGGWITYGSYNPATTAQAVTMLTSMGIDAYSEELTTDAGYSMLDSFIQSACNLDESGMPVSFKSNYEMSQNCAFYSAQSIYATISWYRLMNGQTALYDCTDVVGVPQVEAMIEALPSDITLNEVKAVEEAKAAYDALRDGQKQYIDNYDLLKAAAEKADALKAAAEEEEAFKALKPQLTAAAAGYNSVKLSWKAADGAEGYEVYRATSKNGSYKLVKTITSGKTVTYTDGKLNTGTTYYYKVRAYRKVESSKAYSSYSDIKSAKPVPAAPSLTAKAAGYNSVKLSWKKVDGAEGYRVYRATSKNGTYKAVKTITSGSTVTYTDGKLNTGTTYYYKVRAYRKVESSNVYGIYSDIKSAKPVLAAPSLTAKAAGYNSVKLSWKKADGAEGYRVYRATSKNGTYKAVKTITSGTTVTYTDEKLTTGKTYYYKVRAYRKVGSSNIYSGYSDIKSAKPVPAKATLTSVKNVSGKKAVLSWKAVNGASGYRIYRADTKNGTYKYVKDITSGKTLTWTNSGLTKGKTCYYKIRAYRTVNGTRVYGAYSDVKTVKISK